MNDKAYTEHIYRTVNNIDLSLRVFSPKDLAEGELRPGIVFFFGGGFVNGTVDQFKSQCEYLSSRGMVAMTADYRVKSRHDSTPPDSVSDGRAAVKWIRQNCSTLGVDPAKLAAGGGSAGGGVAANCGWSDSDDKESIPNALVLFNPVVVAAPVEGEELRPEDRVSGYLERWGRESIEEISAYHHIHENYPPTIILHGEADTVCPLSTITVFADKLRSMNLRCDLELYPNENHGFFNPGKGDGSCYFKTLKAADEFLTSLGYLEGKDTINIPSET